MGARKLNVLVYTGTGTTAESVRHCMHTLRQLLSLNYAVTPINETTILTEPWTSTCALLVMPGGADLGYCRVLNGEGTRRIRDYIRGGGSYLGLCAGGYYGSGRCEFEVGNKLLEVVGNRELAFFPGTCRGAAFKGFEYQSEHGAKATKLKISKEVFQEQMAEHTTSYYNGGGVFVDAKSTEVNKIQVLATYDDDIDIDGGDGKAAIVLCEVGNGKAMLTGPHPEFAPDKLSAQPTVPGYEQLIVDLTEATESRIAFLQACLRKLGLEVSATIPGIAPLSNLHLSAFNSDGVTDQLCAWSSVTTSIDGEELIYGENDVFHIRGSDMMQRVDSSTRSFPRFEDVEGRHDGLDGADNKPSWTIIAHEKAIPELKWTPQFDHNLFFLTLKAYRAMEDEAENWGNLMLYGEVVTSTNTILEKQVESALVAVRITNKSSRNPKFISNVPTGFTFAATTQIAGRGRGNNVWIAPPGMLIFSTVINHPAHLATTRPIVFIQYMAAIATVEAIQSYDVEYTNLQVKLKWPNDIYARDPNEPSGRDSYVKIGGIRSQCSYCDGTYQVVVGIGINTTNPRPTISLSDLVGPEAPKLRIEPLLARLLTKFEAVYAQFISEGFSQDLETRYYRHWLHTGQLVTLEAEGGVKARVIGITRDWGLLKVEETDREGRGIGKIWALQSDENSFDYFKGLVRRKV